MGDVEDVECILEVYYTDMDTGEERQVGQVEYYKLGKLAILDVEPDMLSKLEGAIKSVNSKSQIVEMEPGMPNRVTQRTDPDFMQALSRYLKKYYGFSF